ncbi:MAG: hypothetical protein ABIS14_04555 [Sphingomonas sp.]
MPDDDSRMIELDAAREAIETLGLLRPAAAETIARLLQGDINEHPRALCTAYRKAGEQITDQEKSALGIKRNGFLSRIALNEIAPAGLADPLLAHEISLLRASFVVNRYRRVQQASQLSRELGPVFTGFPHTTLHSDCAACNRLDGLVTTADDAFIFPSADCTCVTANYGLSAKLDWLADID